MTTRRSFIRASGATAAMGLTASAGFAKASAPGAGAAMHISETHVHPRWLAALGELGGVHKLDAAFWRSHAGGGVGARRILVMPAPGVEPFARDRGRILAAASNDALAARVRQGNGRLEGYATIVAADAGAVREAERAISGLGLTGLALGANRGLGLADPRLLPVLEFAEAAGVPIYLPASHSPLAGDAAYRAVGAEGILAGAAAENAQHARHLVFGGVLDAFPNLQVVLARLGEGAPYWYNHLQVIEAGLRESGAKSPRRPLVEYFQHNIRMTTADMETRNTVRFVETMIGKNRIVRGDNSAVLLDTLAV